MLSRVFALTVFCAACVHADTAPEYISVCDTSLDLPNMREIAANVNCTELPANSAGKRYVYTYSWRMAEFTLFETMAACKASTALSTTFLKVDECIEVMPAVPPTTTLQLGLPGYNCYPNKDCNTSCDSKSQAQCAAAPYCSWHGVGRVCKSLCYSYSATDCTIHHDDECSLSDLGCAANASFRALEVFLIVCGVIAGVIVLCCIGGIICCIRARRGSQVPPGATPGAVGAPPAGKYGAGGVTSANSL